MGLDLGVVGAALELRDTFSTTLEGAVGKLDSYEKKLESMGGPIGNFASKFDGSFAAAGIATGIFVTGAVAGLTAVGAAVYSLANRGADILDVAGTLDHFAGSSKNAAADLAALRQGVQGTIDDFALTKEAAALLSTGVKLTADDFGTLGQAAFVLQNRGLGTTKDMLDLVSEAMTTGKTKALAMKLGVVEVKDAQADYAASIGTTADKLSQAGIAEANRIAVMKLLSSAVKDAGTQTLDFGEKIDAGRAFVSNFVDEIAKGIATSPALAVAMDSIGEAVTGAFGGDQSTLIQNIVGLLGKTLVVATDVGIGVVETARVFHTAWAGIETIVLGVETALAGVLEVDARVVASVLDLAASLPGATEGMKDAAVTAHAFVDELSNTRKGLEEEAKQAALGITGHSEFDATLDKVGGTLMNMRDRLIEVNAKTADNVATTTEAANAEKLHQTSIDLAKTSMLDKTIALKDAAVAQKKLDELEQKSREDITKLEGETHAMILANTSTEYEAKKVAIEANAELEITRLNKLDPLYKEHYAAIRLHADAALDAIESHWDQVSGKSIEALQHEADAQAATLDKMINGTLHFSRDVIQEQIDKTNAAKDAAKGMGDAYVSAADRATAQTKAHNEELAKTKALADAAAAAANRAMGGSFTPDASNIGDVARQAGVDNGALVSLLHQGYSVQHALEVLQGKWPGGFKGDPGPRLPGFKDGGIVTVGENGPERVALPFGSAVFPNGAAFGGVTPNVTHNWYVNGTAVDLVKQVKKIMQADLNLRAQFGSS